MAWFGRCARGMSTPLGLLAVEHLERRDTCSLSGLKNLPHLRAQSLSFGGADDQSFGSSASLEMPVYLQQESGAYGDGSVFRRLGNAAGKFDPFVACVIEDNVA